MYILKVELYMKMTPQSARKASEILQNVNHPHEVLSTTWDDTGDDYMYVVIRPMEIHTEIHVLTRTLGIHDINIDDW